MRAWPLCVSLLIHQTLFLLFWFWLKDIGATSNPLVYLVVGMAALVLGVSAGSTAALVRMKLDERHD